MVKHGNAWQPFHEQHSECSRGGILPDVNSYMPSCYLLTFDGEGLSHSPLMVDDQAMTFRTGVTGGRKSQQLGILGGSSSWPSSITFGDKHATYLLDRSNPDVLQVCSQHWVVMGGCGRLCVGGQRADPSHDGVGERVAYRRLSMGDIRLLHAWYL